MTKKKTKKMSAETRKRIKEAEAEKREELYKNAEVKVVTAEPDNKITFEQWWMLINKKVKMHAWMKEIVLADFKARKLTTSEPEDKYNEALRLFGIKF